MTRLTATGPTGRHYCDGHYCGYPLAWFACDPIEDGADGEWVCLDCGASMFAGRPLAPSKAATPIAEVPVRNPRAS